MFCYFQVYDGTSEQAPLLIKACGDGVPTPPTVRSTHNQMYIRMKSDGSVSAKGFKANYVTGDKT